MERPGGRIGTNTTILHAGHFACCSRMHDALGIPVEERQVEGLVHAAAVASTIGNERIWVKRIVRPGASSHHRHDSSAVGAYHTEMGEQANTTQESACDDQHEQPYEQSSGAPRNVPPLTFPHWFWQEWHISRRKPGSSLAVLCGALHRRLRRSR